MDEYWVNRGEQLFCKMPFPYILSDARGWGIIRSLRMLDECILLRQDAAAYQEVDAKIYYSITFLTFDGHIRKVTGSIEVR